MLFPKKAPFRQPAVPDHGLHLYSKLRRNTELDCQKQDSSEHPLPAVPAQSVKSHGRLQGSLTVAPAPPRILSTRREIKDKCPPDHEFHPRRVFLILCGNQREQESSTQGPRASLGV